MKTHTPYLKFIAYLQIIGIILVVAGHSLHEYPDGNFGYTTLFYKSLMTFRMPLFMFVSGFLMVFTTQIASQANRTPSSFICTKVKRLLLPFVVLTIVTFIPRAMMSGIADDSVTINGESFAKAFIYRENMIIPFFWFLQASFILLVFHYSLLYFTYRLKIKASYTLSASFFIFLVLSLSTIEFTSAFSLSDIKKLGVFFVAGCIYACIDSKVDRHIPWAKTWFLVSLFIIWATLYYCTIGTKAVFICSLCGIAMCISFAKILEKNNWGFLDHLMGANYLIFLTSWFCNIASQQVLVHFISLPWWLYTILSIVSGVYIPWLGYQYLRKHQESRWVRVASFLLGQSFKKKT